MITSQKGIDLIKHYESFRAKKYFCPVGLPTIGYGHVITEKDRKLNDAELTEEQAQQILAGDLHFFEEQVYKMVGDIQQYQFDALVSFAFNCGAKALQGSTLLKVIKAEPESPQIESLFRAWCHGCVNGKQEVLPGLQKRRSSEAILYNTGQLKFY